MCLVYEDDRLAKVADEIQQPKLVGQHRHSGFLSDQGPKPRT
jgi:hypothetical protein